ncbi:hypothetical protein M9H77_04410 [Catharanthus roseus]|uniref:Uncharacterized protein n=1 Tax=Catharanthus roseus TaxID=4058 RepID=A0ACC0CE02_CATRO|nr:hypothetical protein M9H77_04410 [Catharanthus roseus]
MFHGVDASGILVSPSPIPTKVWMPHDLHTPVPFQYSLVALHQSHSSASSSLVPHPDNSYMHDIHQRRLPRLPGAQYPPLVLNDFLQGYYDISEQMSSYVLESGQHFSQYKGGDGDETTIQTGRNGEGGDVVRAGMLRSRPYEDVYAGTPRLSGAGGGKKKLKKSETDRIIQMIDDDLGVRLSISRASHCGIPMSVISTTSDIACLSMEMRASCYLFSILSNSLFLNKSGLPMESYELWPIVRNLLSVEVVVQESWTGLTFGCLEVRRFLITGGGIPYIQQFVMIGQRFCTVALSYYWMRLDMMTEAEMCSTVWSDSGNSTCPIISLVEHYRSASTKSYDVRHTFTRAFYYDAASHCVHTDHMQYIACLLMFAIRVTFCSLLDTLIR